MPGIDDWTLTPHRILDRIFEECGPTGEWKQKTKEFFENEVSQQSVTKRLPWVNETPLHQLRPNQVVRFRGMVQDMFDNEFYLDTYEVKDTKTGATHLRPGRYKDIAECGVGEEIIPDSQRCETGDRLTYYCLPLPGESQWVKEIYKERNPSLDEGSTSAGGSSRPKRYMGDEDEGCDAAVSESKNAGADNVESMEAETSSGTVDNKRIRTAENESTNAAGASTSQQTSVPSTTNLNFPIPGMKGTPCLLKVYDDQTLSLNEIVEVIGILSVDPSLAPSNPSDQEASDDCMGVMDVEEEAAHCPPPSLVPRIHALTLRKLKHTNPLLAADPSTSRDTLNIIGDFKEAREVLRLLLKEAFLGDDLAAELMICHLLSTVYIRQDVIALGKYSINLSGIGKALQDQQYAKKVYELLSSLVTQSHMLSMTLSNMNTTTFIPKKDYKANRLTSGLLQLGKHTHLVVDETALSAGQLNAKGVQNLTALGNVINWQKLDYDFQYHQIEQHTNIPVLIISEGKSMITSDAQVRMNPTQTDVAAAFSRIESKLTPDVLRRLRAYLTTARLIDYELTEEMQKVVQDDFVESRRNDNSISAEDLHNMLILARLLAVSCGETSLTTDVWKSTKILESERKLRLN